MAARESQGYLIAVIILVLLVLLLALGAFFGISKASEYSAQKTDLEQKLAAEKGLSAAYQIKGEVLKAYVGKLNKTVAEVSIDLERLDGLSRGLDATQQSVIQDVRDDITAITDRYEEDKKQNIAAEGGDAVDFTYTGQLDALNQVLAVKHNELNVKHNDMINSEQVASAEIAKMKTQVDELTNTMKTEAGRFAEALRVEKENVTTLNDGMTQITAANQVTRNELNTTRDNLTGIISGKDVAINDLEEAKAILNKQLFEFQREVFDLPDGRVVRVSNAIGIVHLNLGTSDGLRANRTFAVYDKDVTNFERDQHKGTIEVTKVTGAHSAEARITSQNSTDPILPDDLVLSATWDPGYAVPIALVGVFDLDYDGNSDLERLVQMIEKNGGKVVAYNDDEGNVVGEIDASTRYMVLSDEVPINTSKEILSAMKRLTDQGRENLIQEINTRKLLNWMGQHGRPRIERMDSEMGNEFRQRSPSDTLRDTDK